MRIARYFLSFFLVFCNTVSCQSYHPPRPTVKNEPSVEKRKNTTPWRKVIVLPFSGDPVFQRTAAEWSAYLIGKQGLFELTGPGAAEVELGKRGMRFDGSAIPLESARDAGRMLGADGVIVGFIETRTFWEKRVAGAGIVDVASGGVVATSTRSDVEMSTDLGAVAMTAAERVVSDLLPALHALAGKTWTTPQKKPDAGPWGGP